MCIWNINFQLWFAVLLQQCFVMKRTRQSTIGDASAVKKRTIGHSTFEKWKCDFDREFKTVTWLDCESTVESTIGLTKHT